MGVPSGLAVVTFVLNTLAPSVDALKPFRFLTPFHYYSAHQPITNGFNGIDVLVLLGISLVALLLALATFERRDLAT